MNNAQAQPFQSQSEFNSIDTWRMVWWPGENRCSRWHLEFSWKKENGEVSLWEQYGIRHFVCASIAGTEARQRHHEQAKTGSNSLRRQTWWSEWLVPEKDTKAFNQCGTIEFGIQRKSFNWRKSVYFSLLLATKMIHTCETETDAQQWIEYRSVFSCFHLRLDTALSGGSDGRWGLAWLHS